MTNVIAEKEKAKETILNFVDKFFEYQNNLIEKHPKDFEGADKEDFLVWFWESCGNINERTNSASLVSRRSDPSFI